MNCLEHKLLEITVLANPVRKVTVKEVIAQSVYNFIYKCYEIDLL